MVNDKFNLCKSLSASMRCSQKGLNHIKEKRGFNSKIYLVVNEYGMRINFIVINGSCVDCKEATHLNENINKELVFADCTYDTNEILSYLNQRHVYLQNVIVFVI